MLVEARTNVVITADHRGFTRESVLTLSDGKSLCKQQKTLRLCLRQSKIYFFYRQEPSVESLTVSRDR